MQNANSEHQIPTDSNCTTIPILASWGGRIIMDGEVADYKGGTRRMIAIKQDSTFLELEEKLYHVIGTNRDDHNLRILFKCPLGESQWSSSEVVDDESTAMLFAMCKKVPTIRLLVESTRSLAGAASGGSCGVLERIVDSRDFAISQGHGACKRPRVMPEANVSYAFNPPGMVGNSFEFPPQNSDNFHRPICSPLQPSCGRTSVNPASVRTPNFCHQASVGLSVKAPSSLPDPKGPPCLPIKELEKAGDNNSSPNDENGSTSPNVVNADDHADSEDDLMVDDIVASNDYHDSFQGIQDFYKKVVPINDATSKDNSSGNKIYLSDIIHDITSDVNLFRDRAFLYKELMLNEVKKWHIEHYVQYKVISSTQKRWIIKCVKDDCPWELHASSGWTEEQFRVERISGPHTCINSIVITVDHICKMILPELRAKGMMSPAEIQELVKTKFHICIDYKDAANAQRKALDLNLFYGCGQLVKDLRRFLDIVVQTNPGTVAQFEYEHDTFRRLFWSFAPSVCGFEHCMPVLSVDGTLLKGKFHGSILVAVAYDGDDGIFPLAFAIIRNEPKENWKWFLQCIASQVTRRNNLCIIAPPVRELTEAIKNVFPPRFGHTYRFCLRHMRARMSAAGFSDHKLLSLFYTAGSALSKKVFKDKMKCISDMDKDAHNWILSQGDFQHWALSHDNGQSYGYLTTSFYEICSGFLKRCLGLPLISLISVTFQYLNKIFVRRRTKSQGWKQPLTPGIKEAICRGEEEARRCKVERKDPDVFSVEDDEGDQCEVTFAGDASSCSCRSTELYRIPCCHLIAVYSLNNNTEHHLLTSAFYSVQNYRLSYEGKFHPIPDR